jgi:glycosyltransferase involved in cell wall biosynthesis
VNGNAGDVLFCGAWDEGPGYPRTTALRASLQSIGVVVRECRLPALGTAKKALLARPWRWPAALWRQWMLRRTLRRRLRAALAERRPHCVVVPYPGHLLVRDIARTADVPVVLDLFLSAYDTVVEDRRLVLPGSLGAEWLQRLDAQACEAADLVLLDTPANAAYAAELTGLPAERFAWLPVADPHCPAQPAAWPQSPNGRLQVLFFGTGVPLHGLDTLVAAVADAPGVELVLVGGSASDRAAAERRLGERLRLQPEFVDRTRLQQLIDGCQLVAGVFGSSGKAQRVVPFKVVHALAAGRPVVTAETPAVCAWLDGSEAVFTVPAADVDALAELLRQLAKAPARVQAAAAAARPAYDRHFAVERGGERWRRLLERVARAPGRPA